MRAKLITYKLKLLTVALSLSLVVVAAQPAAQASGAVDTGGYPWASAVLIRPANYDWGYTSCQSAMRHAKMCIGHISYKLGVKYYQSDPWHYDVRNCTSYVAWRINKEFGVQLKQWGDAKNWSFVAEQKGYKVNNQAVVGSIAYWGGYLGHVAFVTSVNPDGSANVEQYNKAGRGEFSRQSRVRAVKYIHIRPPNRVSAKVARAVSVTAKPSSSAKIQIAKAVATVKAPAPLTKTVVKLENLKSQPGKSPLPNKKGFNYQLAIDPKTDRVNVFAVQFANTASHRLEISQSNGADGNTTWRNTWSTSLELTKLNQAKFMVADANSDGHLDLYVINSQSSKSGTTIQVLDGSKDFKQLLGKVLATSQLGQPETERYQTADFNGDGKLDIYAFKAEKSAQLQVKIINGQNYNQLLFKDTRQGKVDLQTDFELGDHNGDGRTDIYVTKLGDKSHLEVKVLTVNPEKAETLTTWETTDPKSTDEATTAAVG